MGASSASHARRLREGYFDRYLVGHGVDMGCGEDPIREDALRYDAIYGKNAESPDDLAPASFDYVFSSHCLEHLHDPPLAIQRWWALVKPGGHLVVTVPDYVLYEQRQWPSRFNADHKWTFSLFKPRTLPPSGDRHLVLSDLFVALDRCQIRSYRMCDERYSYDPTVYDRTWSDGAEADLEMICRKVAWDRWCSQ